MELIAYNQLLKVNPEQGAAITHLTLSGENGQLRSIIEPNDAFEFESSLLFPFPNRMENGKFQFEGKTFEFPLNDFGRPNALHGMIHNLPFQCVKEGESKLVLSLNYEGDLSYYPFPFKLQIDYELEKGRLNIDVRITNSGKESMPCGFGWHPYFNLGDDIDKAKLRLGNVVKAEVNELFIPTGKVTPYHSFDTLASFTDTNLDNCFIFEEEKKEYSVYLVYENKTVLDVWQDKNQRYVQVFIHPNKKAIAIESMTCGINAFNTGQGLKILGPEEEWTFKLGLRYT